MSRSSTPSSMERPPLRRGHALNMTQIIEVPVRPREQAAAAYNAHSLPQPAGPGCGDVSHLAHRVTPNSSCSRGLAVDNALDSCMRNGIDDVSFRRAPGLCSTQDPKTALSDVMRIHHKTCHIRKSRLCRRCLKDHILCSTWKVSSCLPTTARSGSGSKCYW